MSRRVLLVRALSRGAWAGGGLTAVAVATAWTAAVLGHVSGPVHELDGAALLLPLLAGVPAGAALGAVTGLAAAVVLLALARGHLRVHPSRVVLAALVARGPRRRPVR
ncbi:hypothetical protein [Kineococcus sp. SYSU DK018]|uniref:hypothetical protein n=1 Tax=Kineococcus sp. SYSU DK018 TaxID=3383139 RepID=UPI003D7CB4E6